MNFFFLFFKSVEHSVLMTNFYCYLIIVGLVPESARKISQAGAFSAAEGNECIRFTDQIRREISREYNAKGY